MISVLLVAASLAGLPGEPMLAAVGAEHVKVYYEKGMFGDLLSLLFFCALWLIVPLVNWCVASFTRSEEARRKTFAVACYYLLWFAVYALPEDRFGGAESPQNLHLLFAPMLMLGLLPLAHLGEYLIARNRPQRNEHP